METLKLKGFNPLMYIFIFEKIKTDLENGLDSELDKKKLIEIIAIIKENKNEPDMIEARLISFYAEQPQDRPTSRGGSSQEPLQTELKRFIDNAPNIINKIIPHTDSDLLIVNIASKIAAMARIARGDNANGVRNLDELTKTIEYLLLQMTNYKTLLNKTTDETLNAKKEMNNQNIEALIMFVTDANKQVTASTRETSSGISVNFLKKTAGETIDKLKEMLTTNDVGVNIAAAKAILAAGCAIAAIACVSNTFSSNEIGKVGNQVTEGILKIAMNAIYESIASDEPNDGPETVSKKGPEKDPETGSKIDAKSDIKSQITEIISILKKMCNSTNMIELFMEIVYFNEKQEIESA
jgi:hypothetical protein